MEFVGDSALIAHNAAFDRGFINAGLVRAGRDPFAPSRFIDTLMIARELFPGSPASLDALCRRFDISLASRNVHGALIDAELLARVYLELRGGRDRDLDLEMSAAPAQIISMAARQRPSPLRSRLTEAERAAHAEFVKTELGEQAIWTA